jgi:prophage regulatory protein
MATQTQSTLSILRRKQVENRVGLSRTTIYQQVNDGLFPRSINIGPRAVGWLSSEIDAWLEAKIQKSRKA